jgi:hypothetical protein
MSVRLPEAMAPAKRASAEVSTVLVARDATADAGRAFSERDLEQADVSVSVDRV